jgi:hypothetical protein
MIFVAMHNASHYLFCRGTEPRAGARTIPQASDPGRATVRRCIFAARWKDDRNG